MTVIRDATRPNDEEAILAIVTDAFSDATRGADEELAIVRSTWAAWGATQLVELVADHDGTVVAHALAAPGRVDGVRSTVAGVAPVCVAPSHQGLGVGTTLMRSLIAETQSRGWPLLVLLGDPAFYGRVGFEAASPLGLHYAPVGRVNPHFQACVLDHAVVTPRGEFSYCWEPPAMKV